jgi:hypothetical protein
MVVVPPSRELPAGLDHFRVGDADRERVVTVLSEHWQAGRLTTTEFEDRVARAYGARTVGDLRQLLDDLPAPARSLARG